MEGALHMYAYSARKHTYIELVGLYVNFNWCKSLTLSLSSTVCDHPRQGICDICKGKYIRTPYRGIQDILPVQGPCKISITHLKLERAYCTQRRKFSQSAYSHREIIHKHITYTPTYITAPIHHALGNHSYISWVYTIQKIYHSEK